MYKKLLLVLVSILLISSVSSCGSYKRYFWGKAKEGAEVKKILIIKSINKMLLLDKHHRVIKRYRVALGKNPIGHKQQEGDNRTPEGVYHIAGRNPQSRYYLSLRISYPNDADRKRAAERGVSPGGNIMIHGLENGSGSRGIKQHRDSNFYTAGCIAVTNDEIREIWDLVRDGTTVVIRP